jgi:hypothetical protein
MIKALCLLAITVLAATATNALVAQSTNRRDALSAGLAFLAPSVVAAVAFSPNSASAYDDNQVLAEDEMAARIARKQELLRKKKGGGDQTPVSASDIRSDVNPDAGVNLRNRSLAENTKIAIQKQEELKARDKAQKREDMCEMLGRGC